MKKNNPQGLSTLRVILDFGLNLMTLHQNLKGETGEGYFLILS